MNFSQMQERLRLEIVRRIQRGTLSVSLLARQTGFRQSHLSNFLRSHRQLSLAGMDRILAAQHLGTADLLPANAYPAFQPDETTGHVPLVSHAAAMHEPVIRQSSVQSMLGVPGGVLQSAQVRTTSHRQTWERFVAIATSASDAMAMDPVIQPDAIAVLDRHYNTFVPNRPNRPNVYAVRMNTRLKLRYADFLMNRLVLRPHSRSFPIELADLEPGESPGDLVVGRVILIFNEH